MPDADHASDLWRSIANTFKGDNAVIFRLAEEPQPANNSDTSAAWECWKNGDSSCHEGFNVVGFQYLLNIVRSEGQQILQLSGVQYANSMTQFLKYRPVDPGSNSMAVVDIYPDQNPCGNVGCYNKYYAPVIAKMPFMAGEFGESVNGNICSVEKSNALMNWFDQHNSGYSAWTWNNWGTSCGDLSLITDFNGIPHSPNGVNYKSHLLDVLSRPTPKQLSPTIAISPTVTVVCTNGWDRCFYNSFVSSLQNLLYSFLLFIKSLIKL